MADFAANFVINQAVKKVSATKRDITLLLVEVDNKFGLFWVPYRVSNTNISSDPEAARGGGKGAEQFDRRIKRGQNYENMP